MEGTEEHRGENYVFLRISIFLCKNMFLMFPDPEERERAHKKKRKHCFRSGHKLIYCSALKCRHSGSFPQDGKTSFNISLKSLLYILCCEVTFTTSVQSERRVSHKIVSKCQ